MTPQYQFLQSFDSGGINHDKVEYFDVHISYYNLNKVKKLKNISKLRWVTGTDLFLKPGMGSGKLTIGTETTFNVVYAWGGRTVENATFDYNDRTSYTVRLVGDNIGKRIEAIKQQIIAEEEGCFTYKVKFRDYYKKSLKYKNADSHYRALKEMNEAIEYFANKKHLEFDFTPMTEKRIQELVIDFKKKWKANRKEIILHNQMKTIETDMI